MDYANLFIKSIFIENMVFAYFLGMCSYLAVSKTVKTSLGMGFAVIFVLTITVPLNFLIDKYLLQDGALAWLGPEYAELDLSFLSFIMFIAVIASMICAITLIPLANHFWPDKELKADPYREYWHKLTNFIMALTNTRVKQIVWIVSLLGGSLVATMTMLPKTDFMPRAPTDGFFFNLNTPPGGNVQFMGEELLMRIKKRLMPYYTGEKEPGIKDFNFYAFGSNAGGFIYSADPQRVEELMKFAREEIFIDLPDTQVFFFRGSMIQVANGGDGRNINIDLTGPNMDELIAGANVALQGV